MSAYPPQEPPPPTPDYPAASYPASGYPPAPAYPPSPADYAAPAPPPSTPEYLPPAPAPAYPSVPLGAPYPPPGYAPPGYVAPGYPGYMAPGYMAPGYAEPAGSSGLAIASIILAIIGALLVLGGLGFGALVATYGVSNVPTSLPANEVAYLGPAALILYTGLGGLLALLLSIPAVVTGHMGLGRIKRSGGALGGRSAALSGLIMGYIEIAVPIICAIAFVVLIAVIANQ